MNGEEYLANELIKYDCICYYPSSGPDLSNIDYFASGKLLWGERLGEQLPPENIASKKLDSKNDPDLFIHTDVNFYREFESGKELQILAQECGIHSDFEVVLFKELPTLNNPNKIFGNYIHSGKCFEYKFRAWGSEEIKTLIYCLVENEYMVSNIFLKNNIEVAFIWSRNWAGGHTYGTWLVNILDKTHTKKVYTDWLCIAGKRGEPRNKKVEEKYPELISTPKVELVRNNNIKWIDEGTSGWVEEFDVV